MINISPQLLSRYSTFVRHKGVESSSQQYYIKWLRYYLDFCHKYKLPGDAKKSSVAFAAKLKVKKQTEKQRQQAGHAVILYCEVKFHQKSRLHLMPNLFILNK